MCSSDLSKITAPVQGHFAIHDAFFPIGKVDELQQKFDAAGVKYTFYRYDAQHAFGNETNVDKPLPIKYDATAAQTAWKRTTEFFAQHLKG